MGAHFADGASLSRLARVRIQGGLRVDFCFLETLAVIGVAAKRAKYHFVSTTEHMMAGWTLLDCFLLTLLDGSRAKENGILVIVGVTASAHDKFAALRLKQFEEL